MKSTWQKLESLYFRESTNISYSQTWGFVLAAAIFAATCARETYIALRHVPQHYSEPIVGNLAWSASSKFLDYATLFGFVGGFLIFLLVISSLSIRLAKKVGDDVQERLHDFLVLLSTPAGVWFAGLLTTKTRSLWLLEASGVLLVAAVICVFLLTLRSENFWQRDAAQFFRVLAGIFLGILAVGFAIAAIGVGINRIAALCNAGFWLGSKYVYQLIVAALLLYVVGTFLFIFSSRSSSHLEQLLRRSLFLLQIFFPVFFLLLIPTPSFVDNRLVIGYPLSGVAWLAICLLIVVAYIDLFRRYKMDSSSSNTNVVELFSSTCVIGVLLFLKSKPIFVPSISDDYHFGEVLVPWWSLIHQHLVPFWDYAPARGLVNYFPGALASIFFDGTAASLTVIYPILNTAVLLIALPVLRRSVGIGIATVALFFLLSPNGFSEIDILVTVFICVLSQAFLRWNSTTWVVVWLFLDIVILLYAPGQGGLAILATSPLALFMLYEAYLKERKAILSILAVFIILILTIVLITPLGKMVFGAIRYGVEQASVNSIAHGVSWKHSYATADANPWLYELMRASWLLVALWAGVLILEMRSTLFAGTRSVVLAYAIPILLLTTLFIIRAAGRIDQGLTRLETASIWALSLLLPLLLFPGSRFRASGKSIFIWLSLVGIVYPHIARFTVTYAYMFEPAQMSASLAGFVNGSSVGFPKLGVVAMDPSHLARLSAVRKVLDKVLDPQETYLDLTGRHAQYFYFNRRPPIESGSVYNLVTESQQLRAIASLRKQRVPAILISADNILHDGGPVSLRSHLLYRYVLLEPEYKVVKIGGYTWLIRADRIERIHGMDVEFFADIDDGPFNLVHWIFRAPDLGSIAVSWGRSFATLESKMRQVQKIPKDLPAVVHSVALIKNGHYRVLGVDPYVQFNIADLHLRGRDAGIMSFDFTCERTGPPPFIEIYWASSSNQVESEVMVVRFAAQNGHLMVPMDAAPAWLLAKHILSVRFDVYDQNSCATFTIENVKFFQRHGAD